MVLRNERFAGVMALACLLLLFAEAQAEVIAVLLGIPLLAGLALAAFIIGNATQTAATLAEREDEPRNLGSLALVACVALAVAAVFALWPGLDLAAARWLYVGNNRFSAQGHAGNFFRSVGNVTPFVVLAGFLLSWMRNRFGWRVPLPAAVARFRLPGRGVLYLTLAMALGPGLIVNLMMKDHLHRPRPAQVSEFGGKWDYRPFYRFDGQCARNCSFPSGEAAEAFWMLAPASLVPLPWRGVAIAAAVAYGAAVSLLRVAFGGHFLSDILFAALIMWAVLIALRRWLYPR